MHRSSMESKSIPLNSCHWMVPRMRLKFPRSQILDDPSLPLSKKDGTSGKINLEYLVDASGRAGVVSTKYWKNRRYNQGLKDVAIWGYWEGAAVSCPGETGEGQPYFEALDGTFLLYNDPNLCAHADPGRQTQADGLGVSRYITAPGLSELS